MYFGNALADIAAEMAAETWQEPLPLVCQSEQDFGLCFLLSLRLAVVEGHFCAHVASKRVPRPVLEPLPEVIDTLQAGTLAWAKLHASGRRLYNFKGNVAFARCQKVRCRNKAHLWALLPCIPPCDLPQPGSVQRQGHEGHAEDKCQPKPCAQEAGTPCVRRRVTGKRQDPGFGIPVPKRREPWPLPADLAFQGPEAEAASNRRDPGFGTPPAKRHEQQFALPGPKATSSRNPLDCEDDLFEFQPEPRPAAATQLLRVRRR